MVLRNGLERLARVNRGTDEVNLVKLRDNLRRLLQMDENKSIRDIMMVSGNLAKYLRQREVENKCALMANVVRSLGDWSYRRFCWA